MATVINVTVDDQKLALTSTPLIASGGKNENKVQFEFDSSWDEFEKTAVFWQKPGTAYYSIIGSDDSCVIPHEATSGEGDMFFGVFGLFSDVKKTSEIVAYRIVKGVLTENLEPSDPTPDIYEQILSAMADKAEVLWAIVGVTSLTEINRATTSRKIVLAHENASNFNRIYQLQSSTSSGAFFVNISNGLSPSIYMYTVSGEGWSERTVFHPQGEIPSNTYDAYGAATAVQANLDEVTALIPEQASSSNRLADKDFVNSTVGTNTAIFRGTFNSVAELEAYSGTKTNNDYAFVIVYDEVITTQVKRYDRYKYNGSAWSFEYSLNNSSFTAAQWAAIQSGITAELVGLIGHSGTVEPMRIVNVNLDDEIDGTISSDCTIIKTPNRNILVDIGRLGDYGKVKTALLANGVTRLDYIFFTHYHSDHCGLSVVDASDTRTSISLLWDDEDIDTSKTVIILPYPANPSNPSSGSVLYSNDEKTSYERVYASVASAVTANSIVTSLPEEGKYWNVESSVLGVAPVWQTEKPSGRYIVRALNCSAEKWAIYQAAEPTGSSYYNARTYNNYSTILEVECDATLFTLTGDINYTAENANYSEMRMTDVLKMGHHSGNSEYTEAFYQKVNPRYAVFCVDHDVYVEYGKSFTAERPVITWLFNEGIPMYFLSESNTLVWETNGRKFELVSNNRSQTPNKSDNAQLALLWSGSAAKGQTINLGGTGWRNYTLYKVILDGNGTPVLAQRYTGSHEYFRGIGGTASTGTTQYNVIASIACQVEDNNSNLMTVLGTSNASHTASSAYHTTVTNPAIVAIYGII